MAPAVCCGSSNARDQCTCGCPPLLNGAFQLALAQTLVFIGWWFSIAAIGDCSFVTIPGGYVPTESSPDNLPLNVQQDVADGSERRGVGMFTFEDYDGNCYWYTNDYHDDDDYWEELNEDIAEDYIRYFLGSSWRSSQVTAAIPAGLAFYLWVYLLSYCCSTQIRPFRLGTAVFLCIFMTVMQGLSFIVFGTTWCSNKRCDFSRSAGFSIGALLCYFFAGIAFIVTRDYPGTDATAGVKQVDDEDVEGVADDEDKGEDVEEPKEEQAPPTDAEADAPVEEETAAGTENVEVDISDSMKT